MSNPSDLKSIISKMMRFCSLRERCNSDVVKKISSQSLSHRQVEMILVELSKLGYLNEERYAQEYVYSKFKIKRWGRAKIRNGLSQKKIPEKLINKVLNDIEEGIYLENMEYLATNKLKSLNIQAPSLPPEEKRVKLLNYLVSRGYESHVVYDYIKNLI